MRNSKDTQAGLTLIDLLITIAVLFILVVMTLPGTTKNKVKPEKIICTNNLKQVGLAFCVWANEHENKSPMEVSVTNSGAMEAVLSSNVAAVFQVMSNELMSPKILFCPTDKKRIQATTFDRKDPSIGKRGGTLFSSNTNVSYFVGLDAKDTLPSMFLSGDDHFLVGGTNIYGYGGSPAPSGILSLTTNTPIAWNDTRHMRQGNVGLADGSVQGFSSNALRNALANTGVETNRLAMP